MGNQLVMVMVNAISQQDLVFVILVLKELNVKVSLIINALWFDLSRIIKSILAMSCPGNGEAVCNGNGQCDLTTGSCICNPGNRGLDCSGKYHSKKIKVIWV